MIGYIKLIPEAQLFHDPVLGSLRDYFQEENQSGNDRPSIDLCGSLNENVPPECNVQILGSPFGELFKNVFREIRRCGLVGGSVWLGVGFEISQDQTRPTCLPVDCGSGYKALMVLDLGLKRPLHRDTSDHQKN